MTALNDFERLESPGIWRASPDAQRIDVIVSVGDATLTLSDQQGTAIVHWSLPAIERINPGERPALFRPGPDANDILELTDDTMIKANATVQSAIERRRPHPGRLRSVITGGIVLLIAALTIFWLPGAMVDYTASVVPVSKRAEIGESLLTSIRRVSGKSCDSVLGQQSLQKLHRRLFDQELGKIVVLSGGVQLAEHLPGNIVLLNRGLVEDFEDADVAAGFVLVENLRARENDPLVRLLRRAGFLASFRLLTTGDVPKAALAEYAETLLTTIPDVLDEIVLLERFKTAQISSTPYAYAVDISGETTLTLIEGDPVAQQTAKAILLDSDWVSLQGICGD